MIARPAQSGFSLVELSIVLVILGLLTGGILGGQALIRAAELRSFTLDAQKHASSTQAFRDKYLAFPGDMPNATAFWGVAAGNGRDVACRDFKSTGPATCNGDGDGRVESASPINEALRYWQHLASASLLEGQYTGTWNASSLSETSPRMKLRNKHWGVYSWVIAAGNTTTFAGDYGNAISTHEYDVLTPEEAWSVDTKIDDGKPNQGKFWVGKGDATYPCTTLFGQPTDLGAEYNLANTNVVCYPHFLYVF